MDISESMKPQIQSEDPTFVAMYHRHFRHVLAYCGRRLPSSEAADAASDTFLVAWRRFAEMPEGEGERPWLYGVAYRVVSNHRRSAGRRGRLAERLKSNVRAPVTDTAVQVVRGEADREVFEAIAQLDRTDQEVIMLSLWEELPSPDVASALGISEAAVRKRKSRARRRLQRLLQPREGTAVVIPITEAEGEAP
ncbi:MAG: sigma-70 family RNA polymerase sigma factor [Acidimicrobiia bacterium]|nr:sigma-70 family RNA polymerase sigma factor [Acidimicrobiia bacterium]